MSEIEMKLDIKVGTEQAKETFNDIDSLILYLLVVKKAVYGHDTNTEGLYDKYMVINNKTTEVENGVFVLNPEKDLAAREALKTYAKTTDNTVLAKDLEDWMREFEELVCINPKREVCKKVGSPVCCCHCFIRNQCFDDGGPICYYVSSGTVLNIEECKEIDIV